MQAQEPKRVIPDSIRISLLTCASGEEIYSLFGHTAIRYENYTRGIDAVFNYGIFNFNAPNFILRFALGETDYQLGVTDYERFAAEYYYLERDVWQQELNLTPAEKKKLVALLEENYRPENRVYRYNFFYDNCATRPRDLIEKSIDGTLQYADNMTDTNTGTSFRDLLHKYSKGHPWSRFGMDLCMGSQADKPISRRLMMFVPFYVQDYFNTARIIGSDKQVRPLVLNEEKIITTGMEETGQPSEGFTPLQAALLLFILTAAATLYGFWVEWTEWAGIPAIYAVGVASAVGYTQTMVRAAQKVVLDIRRDLFDHILRLPLSFFDATRHGDVMSFFTNDVDTVSEALNNGFASMVQAGIQMVGTQQTVGDAVEGADPHAAHAVTDHLLDPATHLGRRLVGKGHGDDGEG